MQPLTRSKSEEQFRSLALAHAMRSRERFKLLVIDSGLRTVVCRQLVDHPEVVAAL